MWWETNVTIVVLSLDLFWCQLQTAICGIKSHEPLCNSLKKIKIQVMATTTSEWEFMQLKEKMFCYSVLEENSSPYICLNSLLQARIWLSQISLSLKVNFLYKINLNCKTQRTPNTLAKLILSWIFEWHFCVTDTFLF